MSDARRRPLLTLKPVKMSSPGKKLGCYGSTTGEHSNARMLLCRRAYMGPADGVSGNAFSQYSSVEPEQPRASDASSRVRV